MASRISQLVQQEKKEAEVREAQLSEVVAAPLDPMDADFIRAQQDITQRAAQAQADRVEQARERGKRYIVQEIKVDQYNTLRRTVELTPSMCEERNCGYDAAKAIGYGAGWTSVPTQNMLPSGKRLGESILGLLAQHVQQTHGAVNTHILTEEEYANLGGWTPMPGQDPFLTGAKG